MQSLLSPHARVLSMGMASEHGVSLQISKTYTENKLKSYGIHFSKCIHSYFYMYIFSLNVHFKN